MLYYTADWITQDPQAGQLRQRLVGGLLRNGQSKFQTQLPALPFDGVYPFRFGYPLMVDENENLYASMNLGPDTSEILSYDQTGAARFTLPINRENLNGLAENHGLFVEPVSLTAFDSMGNVAWAHTQPESIVDANGHSPVISFDGHITLLRNRHDLDNGVAESYGPDGTLLWQTQLLPSEVAVSSHVLDSAGLLYFVTDQQRLIALRETDGSQVWAITLPTSAQVYNGVLALTPAGSLVASVTERLFGIFSGADLGPMPSWPLLPRGERKWPDPFGEWAVVALSSGGEEDIRQPCPALEGSPRS